MITKTRVSYTLRTDLVEFLKSDADKNDRSITRHLERIIDQYKKNIEKENN